MKDEKVRRALTGAAFMSALRAVRHFGGVASEDLPSA
jgi:hypothetical protein